MPISDIPYGSSRQRFWIKRHCFDHSDLFSEGQVNWWSTRRPTHLKEGIVMLGLHKICIRHTQCSKASVQYVLRKHNFWCQKHFLIFYSFFIQFWPETLQSQHGISRLYPLRHEKTENIEIFT